MIDSNEQEEIRAIRSVGRFNTGQMIEKPGRIRVEQISLDEISIQFTTLDSDYEWVVKEAYEITGKGARTMARLLGNDA